MLADFVNCNPLLNHIIFSRMLADLRQEYGVEIIYGGWLEDRGLLLEWSYLSEVETPIHLGQDIWAPIGTEIASDKHLRVIYAATDKEIDPQTGKPYEHAWGWRVIARVINEPFVLIFGHLQNVKCKVGEHLSPGQVFAEIGSPDENGGWPPHLHVQVCRITSEDKFLYDRPQIDGYGSAADMKRLVHNYPDPLCGFIKLW